MMIFGFASDAVTLEVIPQVQEVMEQNGGSKGSGVVHELVVSQPRFQGWTL